MNKRNRNLEKADCESYDGNYLSHGLCLSWVGEVLQTFDLDTGWSLASDGGSLMDCLDLVVTPKPKYAEICHYTRGKCCKELLGEEEVYCLRRRRGSEWATLTSHIAGECPAVTYEEFT